MRALVTGGCGFIGANLAIALARRGLDIEVVDLRPTHPMLHDFAGGVHVADAGDLDDAFVARFDVVFHQAACTDTTVTDRELMRAHNVHAFAHLLDLVLAAGVDLIYASSAAVYGNSRAPQRVSAGEAPLNVYGASKLEMDTIASARIASAPGRKIIGLRYFNVFGPGEDHKGHMASMILKLGRAMISGQRPRIFHDGTQRRDHLYVDDAVEANIAALAADAAASGIYNVGTGVAVTFNDVVAALNQALRTNLPPDYFDNPYDGYQKHTQADITPTTAALGYRPRFSLSDGIRAYLESGALAF